MRFCLNNRRVRRRVVRSRGVNFKIYVEFFGLTHHVGIVDEWIEEVCRLYQAEPAVSQWSHGGIHTNAWKIKNTFG